MALLRCWFVAVLLPELVRALGLPGGSATLPTTAASASQPLKVLQLQQQNTEASEPSSVFDLLYHGKWEQECIQIQIQ